MRDYTVAQMREELDKDPDLVLTQEFVLWAVAHADEVGEDERRERMKSRAQQDYDRMARALESLVRRYGLEEVQQGLSRINHSGLTH